jgi:hypothetical protein
VPGWWLFRLPRLCRGPRGVGHLIECGLCWLWMQVGQLRSWRFSSSLAAPDRRAPSSRTHRAHPIRPVPSVEAPPHNAGEVSIVLGTTSTLRCVSRLPERNLGVIQTSRVLVAQSRYRCCVLSSGIIWREDFCVLGVSLQYS